MEVSVAHGNHPRKRPNHGAAKDGLGVKGQRLALLVAKAACEAGYQNPTSAKYYTAGGPYLTMWNPRASKERQPEDFETPLQCW